MKMSKVAKQFYAFRINHLPSNQNFKQMKNLFAFLFFTLLHSSLVAQTQVVLPVERPMNNLNLCLLGDGSLISMNYELLTRIHKNAFISTALGVGYQESLEFCFFGPCENLVPKEYLSITHRVTGNFGFKRSFLEIGVGGTYFVGDINKHYVSYTVLGYRFQPLRPGRPVFKFFLNFPMTSNVGNILFSPIGTSLGISF
jgi:hypothetical protein